MLTKYVLLGSAGSPLYRQISHKTKSIYELNYLYLGKIENGSLSFSRIDYSNSTLKKIFFYTRLIIIFRV